MMNNDRIQCVVLAALLLCAVPPAWGQGRGEPGAGGPVGSPSADAAWEVLKETSGPRQFTLGGREASEEARIEAREEQAGAYVAQADLLKAFRETNPAHPEAREAKRLEALNLLYAAWTAEEDKEQKERREATVAEIRGDASLSQDLRGEVAAYAENLKVSRQRDLTGNARLAAYESVVRGLIAEFPEVAAGYGSLLQMARHAEEEDAKRIAADLLAMSAPEWVKDGATALLNAADK